MNGWRVRVIQDDSTFLRDQLKIYMVYKDEEGTRAVAPVVFEMGELLPNQEAYSADSDIKPTVIPRELAEALFNELTYILLQVADPVREIERLRQELAGNRNMLRKLIDGISVIGNKK